MLFILAAIAGRSIYDSSLSPTRSIILHNEIESLLLDYVNRDLSVLLNLVLQCDHQALCEAFSVKEFCDPVILLLTERLADAIESLTSYVPVLKESSMLSLRYRPAC